MRGIDLDAERDGAFGTAMAPFGGKRD